MAEFITINHGIGSSDEWNRYFELLRERRLIIGGSAVGPGISVKESVCGEAMTPTITGYILIQAESLQQAIELMRLSPVHKSGGTVELFPLMKT